MSLRKILPSAGAAASKMTPQMHYVSTVTGNLWLKGFGEKLKDLLERQLLEKYSDMGQPYLAQNVGKVYV